MLSQPTISNLIQMDAVLMSCPGFLQAIKIDRLTPHPVSFRYITPYARDLMQLGIGILTSQGKWLFYIFLYSSIVLAGFWKSFRQKMMGWGPLSRVSVYFAGHMPETVIWTSVETMGCECPN